MNDDDSREETLDIMNEKDTLAELEQSKRELAAGLATPLPDDLAKLWGEDITDPEIMKDARR